MEIYYTRWICTSCGHYHQGYLDLTRCRSCKASTIKPLPDNVLHEKQRLRWVNVIRVRLGKPKLVDKDGLLKEEG